MAILALALAHGAEAAVVCADIRADIRTGTKNSIDTYRLQGYLSSMGYLSAVPNGVFGPATAAAVKSFQKANGIQATGIVGPATRAMIKAKSCSAAPTTSDTPATTASSSGSTSQSSSNTETARKNGFSAPRAGETLAIGRRFAVSWSRDLVAGESVILENATSTPMGFIVNGAIGISSYSWKVGRVQSAQTGTEILVQPGQYRIRVRSASGSDIVSGLFNIAAAPITASSIIPNTVEAGEDNAVIVYGTGFTQSAFVYLDGYRNTSLNKLYVSPDGKILIFSIPSGTPIGPHYITVRTQYELANNIGAVTVSSPQ